MYLLDDGGLVCSPTDLAAAATCEYALLRQLDILLGRAAPTAVADDALLARTATLGDAHEARVLTGYLTDYGPWDPATGRGVACIERVPRGQQTRATLAAKHAETIAVLHTGADVVFQAGFFDGRFGGWADFVVRASDGQAYAVYDSKLARRAKVTALLQLAAYADQLLAAGVPVSDEVHLILGDRSTTSHRVHELIPVYRHRRARLEQLLDDHRDGGTAVGWGRGGHRACGRCDDCRVDVERTRDVLLVAGIRGTQRTRLWAAEIRTVDDLAGHAGPVDGISAAALDSLRQQAILQARQDPLPGGQPVTAPVFDLYSPATVGALPPPDDGDIFFDIEGDPLWWDATDADHAEGWGLEYLLGVVEPPAGGTAAEFRAFWAHDRGQEKASFLQFLRYVEQRRAQFPDMHVYHYASYERTALLRLAGRHGAGEQIIDDWLRSGLLVDLYATVRGSLRTGQRSYSLKQLEPLYMPVHRAGDVTTAADSIVEYAHACELREAGDDIGWQQRLSQIATYNEYDCESTRRLRDWLLDRAAAQGVQPTPRPQLTAAGDEEDDRDVDPVVATLLAYADPGGGPRDADQQAVALLAAAVGYHWREDKPFWWYHFDRLQSPPDEWADSRSTLVADEVAVDVDWHIPPGKRTERRQLRLLGQLEPGSELRAGGKAYALYEPPVPPTLQVAVGGGRGYREVLITEVTADVTGAVPRDLVRVEETVPTGHVGHDALPMALSPGAPPQTKGITAAIQTLATAVAAGLPELPAGAALDLLRRQRPRTRSGSALPTASGREPIADTIVAALLDLDRSYLAVQGPPGTGKTYTGARVIAALVAAGWRIGVVAQSHAVVENLLRGVAAAGVPESAIAKKPGSKGNAATCPWTSVDDKSFAAFYAAQARGYVVGGTTWDFVNAKRRPPDELDLLVVDEAGQFSLANTVAAACAARNVLLLGDPQQLPQVSQGIHPEPVDGSALGWLNHGHDTLPDEFGYFLAQTWRMHPQLCAVVSRLSYDGLLQAAACTSDRHLAGVAPGVHAVPVEHHGNAVASTEEAAEVVARIRELLGRAWTPAADLPARPLEPADVLVVAPYNAQVALIAEALHRAGIDGVRVGTVDRFQGQQAAVVVVSMTASSADDAPRGLSFLLDRNRLNVALSRGQWCALAVYSPRLADHLPGRPAEVEELGAFLRALDGAPPDPAAQPPHQGGPVRAR
ncbi:MAG: TM0106 family RecB-like putative nuclease [Actinomycetota bacterium]|nr:MAG: TM0106 family RecB-like putative nuclease [Actinomycetota bacterium]